MINREANIVLFQSQVTCTKKEADEALDICNDDIIDAVLYLE